MKRKLEKVNGKKDEQTVQPIDYLAAKDRS